MPRKSQSDRAKAEARRLRNETEQLRGRLRLARKTDAAASQAAKSIAYKAAKDAAANPAIAPTTISPRRGESEVAKFLRDIDRHGIEVLEAAEWLGCDAEEMVIALHVVDTRLPRTSKRSIIPPDPKLNRVLPGGVGRS